MHVNLETGTRTDLQEPQISRNERQTNHMFSITNCLDISYFLKCLEQNKILFNFEISLLDFIKNLPVVVFWDLDYGGFRGYPIPPSK